jgi:hypothetical protein
MHVLHQQRSSTPQPFILHSSPRSSRDVTHTLRAKSRTVGDIAATKKQV